LISRKIRFSFVDVEKRGLERMKAAGQFKEAA
jgi:hypothetical protein